MTIHRPILGPCADCDRLYEWVDRNNSWLWCPECYPKHPPAEKGKP